MADPDLPTGTYYKDLNNDLDKFTGTWKSEENNNFFQIIIEKKEYVYDDIFEKYDDMLIGEYQFIENGVEIANTLYRLELDEINGHQYFISGSSILHKFDYPKCSDCLEEERRVLLFFIDPERPKLRSRLILRYLVIDGIEYLECKLQGSGSGVALPQDNYLERRIPLGEYLFIKQD